MDVLQLLDDVDLVIFDLGGVLYDIDFERTRSAFAALPGYNGMPIAFGVDEQDDVFFRVDRGELSDQAFYQALRERYGFTCSDADIEAAWCAILIGPFANAVAWVESVSALRPVVLLSNISHPHLRHALPHIEPIIAPMQRAFYSCTMGLRKPDPACFLHVTQTMGVHPDRSMLLDDSTANCASARGLGMRVIQITRGA
ncbi:MAG: HAD family phosphatase [Candidatus Kapabacteria bacterium]|nr:HAD family phosphatase [Candidatus Kapabacteria bacterium]